MLPPVTSSAHSLQGQTWRLGHSPRFGTTMWGSPAPSTSCPGPEGLNRSSRQHKSLVSRPAQCDLPHVPEDHFGEDVAARYDDSSSAMFDPSVLGPTVDLLAELAGDGAALELA